MGAKDVEKFRRMCRQFRALAMFMVISVGLLLALMVWIAPMVLMALHRPTLTPAQMLAGTIQFSPAACYLFGVWSIGKALGEMAEGRLIQATLPPALRRVGLALGVGGVASVFVVINLMRLIGADKRSFLNFDVGGMTLGMIGGALFLLGRVMDQALAAQAELDEMI